MHSPSFDVKHPHLDRLSISDIRFVCFYFQIALRAFTSPCDQALGSFVSSFIILLLSFVNVSPSLLLSHPVTGQWFQFTVLFIKRLNLLKQQLLCVCVYLCTCVCVCVQ